MLTLPSFHDGYLDGVLLSENKGAHLFVRTQENRRFTIVLKGLKALEISSFWSGNIIFDLILVSPEALTNETVQQAYPHCLSPEENQRRLEKAKEQKLSALEISSSYGAECTALFRDVHVLPDYVLPAFHRTT